MVLVTIFATPTSGEQKSAFVNSEGHAYDYVPFVTNYVGATRRP